MHLVHAMRSPATARPATVLRLQGAVGNAAVQRQIAVQRADDDMKADVPGTGMGALDAIAGGKNLAGGAFQLPEWNNANYTPGGTALSFGQTGAAVGLLSNVTGTAVKSKEVAELRKELSEEKKKPRPDRAKIRQLERELRIAGGDVGSKAAGVGGSLVDMGTAATNIAATGSTAATVMGGVSGGVALPLQVFNGVRDLRKAIKQGERVNQLKRLMNDWEKPQQALEAADTIVAELEREVADLGESLHELRTKNRDRSKNPEILAAMTRQTAALHELDEARKQQQLRQAEKDKMAAAVKTQGANGRPSLETLQMYAAMKSKTGVVKKAISVVGSALGVGGSIAVIVAAAAGSAALAATPVGWALAAAAAAIGIGIGIYKLVRWFQKRGQKSERHANAEAILWWVRNGTPEQKAKAFDLCNSLGLKLSRAQLQTGDEKAIIKLLKAKLAS
ncbi:MAG TPA: hypothetical protein VHN98_04890 [Acidimicrobiales bacterium]|nr:hypothetical protein [Acidimicrobiales bacterium]